MIIFLSNYYNHHQSPFSEEMYKLTNSEYRFIACESMNEEIKAMGWGGEEASFVMHYDSEPIECQRIIDNADVVIYGSAPYKYLRNRLKAGKIVIFYSERIFKVRSSKWMTFLRSIKYFFKYKIYSNIYLLCASAYTAADYALTKVFIGKTYKWGYFPEAKQYDDIDKIIKLKHSASILWVARFIELKHPELPILVAKRLKEEGYIFDLNMIGNGKLEEKVSKMIIEYDLQNCVHILGSMKPDQVRKYMEKSQIFMFTSDRNEGWGAVLNESMNSACAVVASHAIGSVPLMLENGKNGLIYKDGNFESLYNSIKKLLDDKKLCQSLGAEAYNSISNLWNAKIAARRLLSLIEDLQKQGHSSQFDNGPCSRANIIKDDWINDV